MTTSVLSCTSINIINIMTCCRCNSQYVGKLNEHSKSVYMNTAVLQLTNWETQRQGTSTKLVTALRTSPPWLLMYHISRTTSSSTRANLEQQDWMLCSIWHEHLRWYLISPNEWSLVLGFIELPSSHVIQCKMNYTTNNVECIVSNHLCVVKTFIEQEVSYLAHYYYSSN